MSLLHSKVAIILEKVYYLIIVNVLMLISFLFGVTIINGSVAGINSIKKLIVHQEERVIRNFWNKFKEVGFKGLYFNSLLILWGIIIYAVYINYLSTVFIGLVVLFFILIEFYIFICGLITCFLYEEASPIIKFTKNAFIDGHLNKKNIGGSMVSILLSFLIILKIKLLIPIFLSGPIFLIFYLNRNSKEIRYDQL